MFHVRVTIEVVNEHGGLVDHKGYAVRPASRNLPLHSTQEIWGESSKPMALEAAHNRLNTLHAAVKNIGEAING